jgi:hypothetical protein
MVTMIWFCLFYPLLFFLIMHKSQRSGFFFIRLDLVMSTLIGNQYHGVLKRATQPLNQEHPIFCIVGYIIHYFLFLKFTWKIPYGSRLKNLYISRYKYIYSKNMSNSFNTYDTQNMCVYIFIYRGMEYLFIYI